MSDGGSTTQLGAAAVRVTAFDPCFALGIRRLEAVARLDGALSAADKSLLIVAACAVRDRAAVAGEVQSALSLGVAPDSLRALATALYLSRGEAPSRAVLDAVDAQVGPAPVTRDTTPDEVAEAEIVAEFTRVFGAVPHRVELLRQHSPAGLEAYHRMRVAVLGGGALEPAIAELALVCVNAAEHRADFAAVHVTGARRAGATEPQLVEAGLCAVPSGGVAAWLAAAEAIAAGGGDIPHQTNDER